ncbi:glycosyl hydrolases family 8 [Clostridium acetireducens DSM 10703]|uniref:Glycosyl hydrolases family 8 n=1 Tax=Clostridium acetireducens DSM 10703 TaxID=1121290 RepID=A0A1E8F0Q9_9CLOT|nr:glycosyl hydrolase family 8 [Clostridium acetireducens]OFI07021.1 glycosyl hydrolases family 8 [Clostridium acetireducens DSM 10703]
MKKILNKIAIVILIAFIVCFGMYFYRINSIKLNIHWDNINKDEEEIICLDYINKKMHKKGYGIYTNYLDNNLVKPYANGHEVLSESEGLIMLYAVKSGDKKLFDDHLSIVENNLILKNGLLKWRFYKKENRSGTSSAAIDDIRVIRALFYANDRWGEEDNKYRKLLFKISKGVLKYETENNNLVDFYDFNIKTKADYITVCYIDLYTMKLLKNVNNKWENIMKNQEKILINSYISDSFPLYRKSYSYKTNKYSNEEEVNTIESMLSILHLSEIGKCPNTSIQWIKNQMDKKGALYAKYNIKTGEPSSSYESTAVYAIAAQVALNIGDKNMYDLMKSNMLKYQIKDKNSEIYGCFGFEDAKQVYSFDNLQALLAIQKINLKNIIEYVK